MPEFNTAARNAIVQHRAEMYDTAELLDGDGTKVADYELDPDASWGSPSGGEISLGSTINGTALQTHDFDANPGTLVLSGSTGSITETLSAGGPSSGKEAIVQNDLSSPTGEIFDGKEVNLTGLTLVQPAGSIT